MRRVRALARRLACERGYSLSELIVVMAIMTVVLTTLTGLFVSGSRSQLDLADRVQAQASAVVGLGRLRRDVHCASAVTSVTASTVALASTCLPSGTVSWCTTLTSPGRYALRRTTSGTCGATNALLSDYLTTGSLFAYQDSATAATRTKLKVTLPVRAPKMQLAYTLCDVLVLRNVVPPTTGTATVTPC